MAVAEDISSRNFSKGLGCVEVVRLPEGRVRVSLNYLQTQHPDHFYLQVAPAAFAVSDLQQFTDDLHKELETWLLAQTNRYGVEFSVNFMGVFSRIARGWGKESPS